MQPLYIASTDTTIRDLSQRWVHPVTGEVYGSGDWENPQKRAETGAVPLTEADAPHADTDVRDGEILIVAPDGKSATLTRQWRNMTEEETEELRQAKIAEIKQQASIELTKSDWQMLRAIERAMLTVLPAEDQAIAEAREAIRSASDDVEAEIMMAATPAAIKASADVDLALTAEAMLESPEK